MYETVLLSFRKEPVFVPLFFFNILPVFQENHLKVGVARAVSPGHSEVFVAGFRVTSAFQQVERDVVCLKPVYQTYSPD